MFIFVLISVWVGVGGGGGTEEGWEGGSLYSNKGMAQRCTEEVVLETVTAVPVWIHVEEAGLKPLGPDVSSLSDPTDWESRCTEPRVYGIYKKKKR